jgi:hypothetical protein
MKKIILLMFLCLAPALFAMQLPVITLNHEIGQRYQYDLFDEEVYQDYMSFDAYNFNSGYAQVQQAITKAMAFKVRFDYNIKDFEGTNTLQNNAYVYQAGFGWEIIKNLDLDCGFRYTTRQYEFADVKDIEGLSPRLEVRYSPIRLMHLGANYSLVRENYINRERGDNWGNRVNVWYEQRIVPPVNLRLRGRIENRNFDVDPDARTKDSFKYSFAATLRIDLNKTGSKKMYIEESEDKDDDDDGE